MRGPTKKRSNASQNEDEAALFQALALFETPFEAGRFLKDLATPAEIEAFAERWRIARLLSEGGGSYREIAAETGASTTTIGRVARFLNDENYGGYRAMLKKLNERFKG